MGNPTGRRCVNCKQPIQQNERTLTDGKGNYSHNHGAQTNTWKEIK